MSMHKKPLTDIEREGLKKHGLAIDKPSQLSDAFRTGVAWALAQQVEQKSPFDSKRKEAMAVYTPPFKYLHGYIYDSQNLMVADDGDVKFGVEGAVASRVRGWGRLGYMPNGAELQDEIGQMMADALNALYAGAAPAAQPMQGDEYKRGFSDGMKEAPTGEEWIRVIDEAMVGAHLGVADMSDDYGTAKKKLNDLICWSVEVDRESARHAPAAQPVQGEKSPIPSGISDDLERSDWTVEEALRWYAAGKFYDTVPNGDGTSRPRILDNGAIASNALKSLSPEYAKHKGDVALLASTPSTPQPDTRKVIEQMVGALENSSETVFICADKAILREAAIQAGQRWLEENK